MAFFEWFQLLCIFIVLFQFLKLICVPLYSFLIGPKLALNTDLSKTGKWAVVTGSTDGIGKAYAESLAKKGLNIVLISRSQSKLDDVASSIEKTYGVKTKTIAADFTLGEKIYPNISESLKDLEIGVLVNNVGIGYDFPQYFLDIDNKDTFFSNIIQCNIISVINMCKIVMPDMVKRKKGVVINVSSMSEKLPASLLSVYGATKAFVGKLSRDLETEYSQHGLTVQCVTPGFVASKLSKIKKTSWLIPSPQDYVETAVDTVGLQKDTTGYFSHWVMHQVVDISNNIFPTLTACISKNILDKQRVRHLKKHVQ